MASKFKATPLFDAHKAFVRLPMGMAMLDGYPDSKQFIETLCKPFPMFVRIFCILRHSLKAIAENLKPPFVATATRLSAYCSGHGLSPTRALSSLSGQI